MVSRLCLDTDQAFRHIVLFLREQTTAAGLPRVVLGMSGGVDSSLCAALATEALGPSSVLALMMPYRTSSPDSVDDARSVAEQLGIEWRLLDISPQIDAYLKRFPDADQLRRGNKMARERMSVLYDHSKLFRALVVGCSNKTERLLGYATLWGDMACDLAPIGDLYKTEVLQLARALAVPNQIIGKPPTADLWPGQTDEEELGVTYAQTDLLLYELIEHRRGREELIACGLPDTMVDRVIDLKRQSEHKRRMPPVCVLPLELRGAEVSEA